MFDSRYDGGLQTTYVVEAWAGGIVIANASNVIPAWRLRELGAGRTLKLRFYAYNARGRSESFTLKINTLTRLALHNVLYLNEYNLPATRSKPESLSNAGIRSELKTKEIELDFNFFYSLMSAGPGSISRTG
ncbi:hypothetical protein EVAR_43399_1 [Eumeta japonica]|uniref:Uncharacterized protein n=1 Tax=Eumeta variegata TaxID=151549 RepID=A0A4C1WT32_EUMVA|nr:hypothetical protein EVAR_43399_1 [Eumeta japonica]